MQHDILYGWWGGGVVESGAPAWAENQPPPDPSEISAMFCLAGDTTVVAPPTEKSYKRLYNGEVVTIETASGNELTGTPNHPVLTDKGWLSLKALHKGSYVISSPGFRELAGSKPDYYDEPASLEDVHRSLADAGVIDRHPGTPLDFHGDGRDSEVEVVIPERVLRDGREAPLFEKSFELDFSDTPPADAALAVSGSSDEKATGIGFLPRFVGGANLSKPLSGLQLLILEALGLRDASTGNPRFFEHSINGSGADPEASRNLPDVFPAKVGADDGFRVERQAIGRRAARFLPVSPIQAGALTGTTTLDPSPVEPPLDAGDGHAETSSDLRGGLPPDICCDEVVRINVRQFSGHVYNLQTEPGYYVANGIISHNCVAVGNLMLRALLMFGEGYVIPTAGSEDYDGGTVAVEAYYSSYGTLEPFDLDFATTHEGTICLRRFSRANNSEGHYMVTAYYEGDGRMYALQSYPNDASGEPGLNWDYTVEQSHAGGYYEYMVRPWNWLPITEAEYMGETGTTDGPTTENPPGAQDSTTSLTAELLIKAMTGNSFSGPDLEPSDAERYLPHLVKACEDRGITNRARLSAFLAQAGAESGSFKWWRELTRGEGKPYGVWYGRGPMQLTWEQNYQDLQEATGIRAHDDPEIIADDAQSGFRSAAWFWRGRGLNELADVATWQSFYEITGRVWGQSGPVAERDARYQVAWDALPEDLVVAGEPDAPEPTEPEKEPWVGFSRDPDQAWAAAVDMPPGSWIGFPRYSDGLRYAVLYIPEEEG